MLGSFLCLSMVKCLLKIGQKTRDMRKMARILLQHTVLETKNNSTGVVLVKVIDIKHS